MEQEQLLKCINSIREHYHEGRNMSKKDIMEIATSCKVPAEEVAKAIILKKIK